MLTAILVLVALQAVPSEQVPDGGRIPVTIALVDSIPEANAKALIIRKGGGSPRDIIVFRRKHADPGVFSAAVAAYLVSRLDFNAAPDRDFRILVLSESGPPAWKREHAKFAAITARLRAEPLLFVPDVGPAQATEIWVAPIVPHRIGK